MRARLAVSLGFSGFFLLLARPAAAEQLTFYNVYKVQQYVQTSASPPSAMTGGYCNMGIDVDAADALTAATATWTTTTGSSPATFQFASTDGATRWSYWWPGVVISTKGELDDLCPITTYTFAIEGGGSARRAGRSTSRPTRTRRKRPPSTRPPGSRCRR